jgi:predicted metalloprotease with PDZ domain
MTGERERAREIVRRVRDHAIRAGNRHASIDEVTAALLDERRRAIEELVARADEVCGPDLAAAIRALAEGMSETPEVRAERTGEPA